MKKKIISYLSLLFVIFTCGVVISMVYIYFTTTQLENLILLHNVDVLRQDLIIKIQNVEQDLLTVHTELATNLDEIVMNVNDMDSAINRCAGCHHSREVVEQVVIVKDKIEEFKKSLSYYITASADTGRIRAFRLEAHQIGSELFSKTSNMALIAHQKLDERTKKALRDVSKAQQILSVTLFIAMLLSLWIAAALTRKIINPIRELIHVARKIGSGNLGFKTEYSDDTEFGELALSFNEMSVSLKESNEKNIQHLNRLAGLYRVTLPLHAASDIKEFYREVSFSVAELIGAEQCGLIILNEVSGIFEHVAPAFGVSDKLISAIRVPKDRMEKFYFLCNRRPVVLTDVSSGTVPPGMEECDDVPLRNMLLGWVRQKGELIGVIRLANKREGNFGEEASKFIGIVSNNISVAMDNIRLYDDLRAQMKQLKQAQEQLIQTAKLAAIGELASNIAHEINNPLTSILGYAELVREETMDENVLKDIEIISRESVRARDIVQQLLEFARKKDLEIREVDINKLLQEVISLVSVNLKDPRISISERFSDLPLVMADPNQLKQVFLNLINNAIDAVSAKGGAIVIKTQRQDSLVSIEIEDNGYGIPEAVIGRIFEPFYTTKKDKGTGLGLPITFKIIQSHGGVINVSSTESKGTVFTVLLPIGIEEALSSPKAQNIMAS